MTREPGCCFQQHVQLRPLDRRGSSSSLRHAPARDGDTQARGRIRFGRSRGSTIRCSLQPAAGPADRGLGPFFLGSLVARAEFDPEECARSTTQTPPTFHLSRSGFSKGRFRKRTPCSPRPRREEQTPPCALWLLWPQNTSPIHARRLRTNHQASATQRRHSFTLPLAAL